MKIAAVFVICLLHAVVGDDNLDAFCKTVDLPDYYWREYTGVIPYDAVSGGTERSGVPTYIGQAMVHPFGQLPATIYHGNESAVTSVDLQTRYIDRDLKILCSGSPEKFQWISTDIHKIHLITNCRLMLGGVDSGHQVNIGRINYNEEIIIGKVIRKPLNHEGLWVPDNGRETKFSHYEVLAYDCKPKTYEKYMNAE